MLQVGTAASTLSILLVGRCKSAAAVLIFQTYESNTWYLVIFHLRLFYAHDGTLSILTIFPTEILDTQKYYAYRHSNVSNNVSVSTDTQLFSGIYLLFSTSYFSAGRCVLPETRCVRIIYQKYININNSP